MAGPASRSTCSQGHQTGIGRTRPTHPVRHGPWRPPLLASGVHTHALAERHLQVLSRRRGEVFCSPQHKRYQEALRWTRSR